MSLRHHLAEQHGSHMDRRVPLIAHVIYRLDVGGLENGLVNLINRIPDARYQHAIICLTDYTGFRHRITRNVELFALHKREGNDMSLYLRLWRLFRRLRPDIVHTRNLATVEAQLVATLASVPRRVHGEHGRDIQDLDGTHWKYRMLRRLLSPLIDRYIPLSVELQQYLQTEIGIPGNKISQIYNGVDTERFCPGTNKHNVLPAALASPGKVVIGTIGRMEAVKDQLTLASAFQMLVNRVPDGRQRLALVMVGDGSHRQRVHSTFDEAHLSKIVWFPGQRDNVPELLQAFDVFVLPSLAEGISNTILEAMATGLPVVATDVGGNGELVSHGNTGYLVPSKNAELMADAIRRYAEDPELRATHGQRARSIVESKFDLSTMVQRHLAVYDDRLHGKQETGHGKEFGIG